MKNKHIFISYSRKDSEKANRLVAEMRNAGISVWQDVSGAGAGIPYSVKWYEVVVEALYLADGVIIFHSQNWEDSNPCKKEKELIDRCKLPSIQISPDEVGDDLNPVISKIQTFLANEVRSFQNQIRGEIYAAAYELQKGVKPNLIVGSTGKFVGNLRYLIFHLTLLKNYVRENKIEQTDKEIYPYMIKYLSEAKKIALRRFLRTSAIAMFGFALLFSISVIYHVSKNIAALNSDGAYDMMAVSGEIAEYKDYDPAYIMDIIGRMDGELLVNGAVCETFNMHALQLNDMVIPDHVYIFKDGDTNEDEIIHPNLESDRYNVELSSTTGTVIINDNMMGTRFSVNIPAIPNHYSWNENGKLLAVSSGSKAFVLDPSAGVYPIELRESYETIEKIGFVNKDGKEYIAAESNRNTVLLWENPISESSSERQIRYGYIISGDEPSAIYVADNELIVKKSNTESEIYFNEEGNLLADSFDICEKEHKTVLISEEDGEEGLKCVDYITGEVLAQISLSKNITDVKFDPSGNRVYATTFGDSLVCWDIQSGEIEESSEKWYLKGLERYGENWVVWDYSGYAVLYGSNLKVIREIGGTNYGAPIFDAEIDSSNGYLFSVIRGGAKAGGSIRYDVKTGEILLFAVPSEEKVAANTALDLSEDNNLIAYGYPNGKVRIYEPGSMSMVLEKQVSNHSVSAVRFSEDSKKVFILLDTGELLTVSSENRPLNNDLAARKDNWNRIAEKVYKKVEDYYAGIEE